MQPRLYILPTLALALCLLAGCNKDTVIKLTKSASNTVGVVTLNADEFIPLAEKAPAYPAYYEYRGVEGNYHYLYYFDIMKRTKIKALKKIYRTHVDNLPDDFEETHKLKQPGWDDPSQMARDDEPEPKPKKREARIPNVGGF